MKKVLFTMIVAIACCLVLTSCEKENCIEITDSKISSYEVYMGYELKNENLTLTIKKFTEKDIATAIEINDEVVKTSTTCPYTYSKSLRNGVYKVRLIYSYDYSENDGNVELKEPISEASSFTIRICRD